MTFTDADGTAAVVRVKDGTATVTLDGPALTQTTANNAVTVNGAAVMTHMVLTGANPTVYVRTRGGDGFVTLGGVSAAGPVNAIFGRGLIVGGVLNFASGTGELDVGGVRNATITLSRGAGAGPAGTCLILGDVDGGAVNSAQTFVLPQ